MAQVLWKDIVWTGDNKDLSIKELLTILKGYGPMEVLHFEKSNQYQGELSLWLDEEGIKHITLFHLEVIGEKRKGVGREALRYLRRIFGGDVYVQDPGETTFAEEMVGGIHVSQPNPESAMFWLKVFEEKIIQSVEGDLMNLNEATSPEELESLKRQFSTGPENHVRTNSVTSNSL